MQNVKLKTISLKKADVKEAELLEKMKKCALSQTCLCLFEIIIVRIILIPLVDTTPQKDCSSNTIAFEI